jgi:hypothetical protein
LNGQSDLASTSDSAANLLAEVGAAADEAGLATALIGGAAVNAFEDPRFTKDLDLTVQADARAVSRFVASLERNGFEVLRRQDEGSSSGPDFVQLIRPGTPDMIDIITAKTEYRTSDPRAGTISAHRDTRRPDRSQAHRQPPDRPHRHVPARSRQPH